ncbi:hypothetical protein AUJ68_04985 [Candidatus Woesearchaeota archaeon CG1_02_57_44]|nr:MAG: hypothetical protein AUJ68_04985 [Candidatus Woesearchaeota archaeon CG1_02_57_44]
MKQQTVRLTKSRVVKTVSEAVGPDVVPVVESLWGKQDLSEFIIAQKLKMEIHQVRNLLYRLYAQHLATYFKKKDREKGWYVGYWTFNKPRVHEIVESLKAQKLDKLKTRLRREVAQRDNFYLCPHGCVRATFDNAADLQFKCPECSSILSVQENGRTIENLKAQIQQLEA